MEKRDRNRLEEFNEAEGEEGLCNIFNNKDKDYWVEGEEKKQQNI